VPPVRIRSVPRSAFTPDLLADLHALANRFMAEDAAHFNVHARSNDVVHIFEEPSGIVGFQFWRLAALDRPGCKAILGGKLRVLPSHRRHALHLRSGLRFYLESSLRHPFTRFYRLSLAGLFGFVSLVSALADYRFVDPGDGDDESIMIRSAFDRLAAESDFKPIAGTGLYFVDILPSAETLAAYAPAYFERPEARAYLRANPDFRTNGCNVAFWWRFNPRNLTKLIRTIARKAGVLRLV
jgi:hypothetical protein